MSLSPMGPWSLRLRQRRWPARRSGAADYSDIVASHATWSPSPDPGQAVLASDRMSGLTPSGRLGPGRLFAEGDLR